MVDVSIIIVSYNSTEEILANIESIEKNIQSLKYEILVVNNYAGDNRLSSALKAKSKVRIIEAGANLGFGRANNLGLKEAKGKYILFVNPDVIFQTDISQLTGMLENDHEIGLIGPLTYGGNGRILPSCKEYPGVKNFISYNFFLNSLFPRIKWWGNFPMKYFNFSGTREVDWISGAFMLGRKSVIERVNGFDGDFFMYCEDTDLCWRLKKSGYKIIFSDKASIIHNAGHAAKSKSPATARMLVESCSVLWGKHYSMRTVKTLFIILYLGSFIRKLIWLILSFTMISDGKNMINYYQTMIKESMSYIKG